MQEYNTGDCGPWHFLQIAGLACRTASYSNEHCLFLWPSLENVPVFALVNPQKSEHNFSHCCLHFELLFWTSDCGYVLHEQVFAVWIIVLDQCVVLSDDTSQKVSHLCFIVIQKLLADIQAYTQVLLCGLFRNPCCTESVRVYSVVDGFMGGAVTDLPLDQ
jgi:hypothetical protein